MTELMAERLRMAVLDAAQAYVKEYKERCADVVESKRNGSDVTELLAAARRNYYRGALDALMPIMTILEFDDAKRLIQREMEGA